MLKTIISFITIVCLTGVGYIFWEARDTQED
jgi:hypothetical protein